MESVELKGSLCPNPNTRLETPQYTMITYNTGNNHGLAALRGCTSSYITLPLRHIAGSEGRPHLQLQAQAIAPGFVYVAKKLRMRIARW